MKVHYETFIIDYGEIPTCPIENVSKILYVAQDGLIKTTTDIDYWVPISMVTVTQIIPREVAMKQFNWEELSRYARALQLKLERKINNKFKEILKIEPNARLIMLKREGNLYAMEIDLELMSVCECSLMGVL